MELDYNKEKISCPKTDCHKKPCKCALTFYMIPAMLGDDTAGSQVAPKNGAFCNKIVKYEANGAVYIYGDDGIPVNIKEGKE